VEGPTDNPDINALRLRQMKNFFVTLLMSHGTPMFLMGDEVCRTQQGNNNPYAQDNTVSWFDWRGPKQHEELLRFVQGLLQLRRERRPFRWDRFWAKGPEENAAPQLIWHGITPGKPDLGVDSHSLAYELRSAEGTDAIYVILNAYWGALRFQLPKPPSERPWRRVVDTSRPSPNDISTSGEIVNSTIYEAGPRSAVILLSS
jgi:glycogen operon protein